jgi:hypothetical protein
MLARRAAVAAAGASLAGGVGFHNWWQRQLLEKQQDAAVEARLPSMDEAQRTSVIRLPRLLTDDDIYSVRRLQETLAYQMGTATARKQSAAAYKTGAAIEPDLNQGWNITYLNTGGAFSRELPHIRQKILDAATRADGELGVLQHTTYPVVPRCVEYHRVVPPGSLPQLHHNDEGSVLTCDMMLSDPGKDFTGGEFRTLESDGTLTTHTFDRGDCLIFVSHKPHCVAPVQSGERRVLVCELWEGVERQCAHRCERHWSPCDHGTTRVGADA